MKSVWEVLPKQAPIISQKEQLAKQLLSNRGIITKDQEELFFNATLADYKKELEISGIKKAQQRIKKAIEKKETIYIYGDYDVDGICATAILYHALVSIGAKVLPYIPHREKEGYGLSKIGLEKIKSDGGKLVITVDNGIVAIEPAEYAKSLGLDLIITDHHLPLDRLPQSSAIVHTTAMCGAAVAWCMVRTLVTTEMSQELLDLVGIATVCDMIPLLGVNRVFTRLGLEKLNSTKRVGLLALFAECGLPQGSFNTFKISYILGPRLNAIGRLEHAIDGLRLLCTKDFVKASSLAKKLGEVNSQRKILTDTALLEVDQLLSGSLDINNQKVVVLSSRNWMSGIVGLIAGKVAEKYNLPALIISEGEVYSRGSARSIKGLNIVELIRKQQDILIDVGGHAAAAGFSIDNTKIEIFKDRIIESMNEVSVSEEVPIVVEGLVDLKKVNKDWIDVISQFEPFGIANQKPVIGSMLCRVTDIRTVGGGKHLKFFAEGVEAIAFSKGNFAKLIVPGQLLNLAYYLEINGYNGGQRLQLNVVDIQLE